MQSGQGGGGGTGSDGCGSSVSSSGSGVSYQRSPTTRRRLRCWLPAPVGGSDSFDGIVNQWTKCKLNLAMIDSAEWLFFCTSESAVGRERGEGGKKGEEGRDRETERQAKGGIKRWGERRKDWWEKEDMER